MASIYDKASLVMIPSGSKEGKLYSQKPTNGDGDFTFSRSTAATRVNASGNIEKETQNLVTYSNTFSTGWVQDRILSATGGQAGYDESNDAWFVVPTNVVTYHTIRQSSSQTGIVTISVYAKAETYDGILLYSSSNTNGKFFNVSNGTLGDDFGSNVIDATITDVGNGWYRCSVTLNKTGTGNVEVLLSSDGVNTYTFAGDGVGGVYIQDFQLEQGLVARDYIETTTTAIYGGITDNVPRLDYTDSSCPALLLEPQRTNLSIQSEYITGSGAPLAIQSAGMTISYNQTTSPEGVDNAMKWTEASNNGLHWGGLNLTGTSVGDDLTISIFAKRGTSNDRDIIINIYDGATSDRARYNLDSGTISTDSAASNQPVVSMEDYGNGWWRCIYTRNLANSGYNAVVGLVNGGLPSWQGNGTSNIYTYGLQYEVGSYATSYIPTYGSAVTRNADSYYNNNMASLYDSANGFCLYFEYADVKRGDTAFFDYFSFQQLPNTDTGFRAEAAGTNNLEWRIYTDNIDSDLGFPMRVSNIESKRKVLMKVETTGIKLFADGSLEDSQSGYVVIPTLGTLQPLRSTAQPSVTQIKQSLGQILYLPVLTDEECIDLTTL